MPKIHPGIICHKLVICPRPNHYLIRKERWEKNGVKPSKKMLTSSSRLTSLEKSGFLPDYTDLNRACPKE